MKIVCTLCLTLCLALLVGCSHAPPTMGPGRGPCFVAPWVAMAVPPAPRAPTQLTSAHVMLEDAPLYERWEKAIIGPIPLATYSAYTDYTYDAQPIGLPGGVGYRYRYIWRQSLEVP